MKRDYRLYLEDIMEAIDRIEEYASNLTFEKFVRDRKTIDAIIRNFEIIGEAAKHVPLEIREKYPKVPWKSMAGIRDKLIHEYFVIKLDVIWKTIKERLPEVKVLIKEILIELNDQGTNSK